VYAAKAGHLGGPLSVSDILAALYFDVAHVDPQRPDDPKRDRVVLSKGHSSIALYATLAVRGYFGVDELATFDQIGSRLQGHPDMTRTPGVDISTGSLGQGLSVAAGMALASRLSGTPYRAFAILGDGECQEGQVWEAARFAASQQLGNLVAIVDANGLGQWGSELPPHEPVPGLANVWRAFGWDVIEGDGHDLAFLTAVLDVPYADYGTPRCVVAQTVKGRGVKRFEGNYKWHSRVPTDAEYAEIVTEFDDTEPVHA